MFMPAALSSRLWVVPLHGLWVSKEDQQLAFQAPDTGSIKVSGSATNDQKKQKAIFQPLDGPIRANRCADSRESPDSPGEKSQPAPKFRKIRAPIKIKSALPPPPQNLPQKRGILRTQVFPAERTHFFQVSIKLAHPLPAPELRTRILWTRGFF